jgi:hypothetical protein
MDGRLERLLDLLDQGSGEAVGTSIRLPANLRDAAALATELGLVSSTSEPTVQGLRDVLEARAQRAILDAHYAANPAVRPGLAEIALATAEIDGNPLMNEPERVRDAARAVIRMKDDATADDVLMYAAGLSAAAA